MMATFLRKKVFCAQEAIGVIGNKNLKEAHLGKNNILSYINRED